MKKIFKNIAIYLLILITVVSTINIESLAFPGSLDTTIEETGDSNGGDYQGSGTAAKGWDVYPHTDNIGLRFYVVDENMNVITSASGYSVYDYWNSYTSSSFFP